MNLERAFKFDNQRIALLLIFVCMFVVTEIGRQIYRPYIYANDIFDFWVADTIGNFTGTIAIVFFDLAVVNPEHKKGRIVVLVVTAGLIVYELLQTFSPRSICDWRDIIATLIAGLISLGVYELVYRKES